MSVAIISAIGQAANKLILHHPKRLYQERIDELKVYVTELDGHITKMQKLRSQLHQFWEGDSADRYDALLASELKSLESSRNIVISDITFYQGLIADLESTENITSALMGDMESALNALESKLGSASGGGDGSFGGGAGGGGIR